MKKLLSILCTAGMTAALLAGCGKAEQTTTEQPATDTAQETEAATETAEVTDTADSAEQPADGTLIALITMDSLDQHWVTLNEGAQKAAGELGVTVKFMAPNTKDDAQQIGLLQGFGRTKFLDVRPTRERLARAGDDDGFHRRVGIGLVDASRNALARGQPEPVDGGIVEGDNGNVAVDSGVSGHAVVPWCLKNERSCVFDCKSFMWQSNDPMSQPGQAHRNLPRSLSSKHRRTGFAGRQVLPPARGLAEAERSPRSLGVCLIF